MRHFLTVLVLAAGLGSCGVQSTAYDLVLRGGRVIDPETGLDAVRNVGIRNGRIAAVSSRELAAPRVLDVHGLVVAPGFIDLHQHQQDSQSYRLKALDGVATALELETGVPDIAAFVDQRRGKTPIHFGATASHEAARVGAWGLRSAESTFGPSAGIPDPPAGPVTDSPATPAQTDRLLGLLRAQLDAGALGIGIGLEYTPGASRDEIVEVFQLAAEYGRPVFVHVRSAGTIEPGSSIQSVLEVISASAVTGASAHVVHINSSCLRQSFRCLELIEGARKRHLDITAEAYPYTAGMAYINSALFSPGWRERRAIDYSDVEIPETGERLTQALFDRMHGSQEPRLVLIHMNPEDVVDDNIRNSSVMIASDGIDGHPRNAGTFARVLARQVRETGKLTLLDAVRKLSLMQAQRLEASTSDARRKGRVQEGADADIVVFDLASIQDRATFANPRTPSTGVRYLLVGGTLVVDDGTIVEGAAPGQPLMAARTTGPQ